jgi:hypothetical protein
MLGDESLFYLPQRRDTLLDRITNAYFRREQPSYLDAGMLTDDQRLPSSSLDLTRPERRPEAIPKCDATAPTKADTAER